MAKYYQNNLSEVKKLQKMADSLAQDPYPTKNLIDTFIKNVNIFVEDELQDQNVKFLNVTKRTEG